MNLVSDILCHPSTLTVSSANCNGPLLSHNSSMATKVSVNHNPLVSPDTGQVHLLNTLSNIGNLETPVVSSSSTISPDMGCDLLHSVANNSVPSSFHQSSSSFAVNSFNNSMSSWLANDLLKTSGNIHSSGILPPVAEIYPKPNGTLRMLDARFPPELSPQSNISDNLRNRSCISNNQKLITETVTVEGFPSDPLSLSTFSHMNNSQLQVSVSKVRLPFQKMKQNSVTSHSNSSQPLMNPVIPLSEHCEISSHNELLHLPLSSQNISEQCLNTSVNSAVLSSNHNANHSLDMVSEKLPQISLTHLDSLLQGGSTMTGIQMLQNNLPAVHISPETTCNSHTQGSNIESSDSPAEVISCTNGPLSEMNLTASLTTSQDVSLQVSEPLSESTLEPEIEHCSSFGDAFLDSAIEETRCFKCKFCLFISLSKFQVANHIKLSHSKTSDAIHSLSPTELRTVENVLHYNRSENGSFPSNSVQVLNERINTISSHPCSGALAAFANVTPAFNSSHTLLTNNNEQTLPLISGNENKFICGKCHAGFSSLKECKAHLSSNHNIKSYSVRLEPVKGKSTLQPIRNNDERAAQTASLTAIDLNSISHNNDSMICISNSSNTGNTFTLKKGLPNKTITFKGNDDAIKKAANKKANKEDTKSHSTPRQMSSHKKAWQKKMKREQGSYICEFKGCNVRFRALDNLEYHRKCHISGSSAFACPECGFHLEQWCSIAGHLWRRHYVDMELHACNQCTFHTYSLSRLENHKKIHQDVYLFLCDTCGKGFKTGKQLRNHRVIHAKRPKKAQSKVFECCICCRHFSSKRMLRLHLDTVHNKLRPFLCNYCGYAASNRGTLKMHLRQHTGEKPFSCDLCDYKTSDHNSLRRHKMKHSGEKPYKCPYCPYACIQSSTYKAHLKKKHPGQDEGLMFSCTLCSFRTVKQENYITHIADHDMESMNHADSITLSNSAEATSSQSEILPLVEAMDISLSHGSHSNLACLDSFSGKHKSDIQSILRTLDMSDKPFLE